MLLREREKEEGSRRAGRGKGKKHKWTKNQEIIVLAGVVIAIGIAVAMYQNQRGSNGGVLVSSGERRAGVAGPGKTQLVDVVFSSGYLEVLKLYLREGILTTFS